MICFFSKYQASSRKYDPKISRVSLGLICMLHDLKGAKQRNFFPKPIFLHILEDTNFRNVAGKFHRKIPQICSTTRKKCILEELPNSSETEDIRKIR